MSKSKNSTYNYHPFVRYSVAHNISIMGLCKLLGLSTKTFYKWIVSPSIIPLGKLYKLAGICEISIHEIIYLLEKNNGKMQDSDSWYLEKKISGIKLKHQTPEE